MHTECHISILVTKAQANETIFLCPSLAAQTHTHHPHLGEKHIGWVRDKSRHIIEIRVYVNFDAN